MLNVADDGVRRAAPRSDYYPVLLIQPASGEVLLGCDFMSEPLRGAALAATLRSGRPAASAPVRLNQTGTLGVHLLQRVAGLDTEPTGVLNLELRANAYVGRAVAQSGFKHFLVAFADITERASPVTMTDTIGAHANGPRYRGELAFGGRRYELHLAPDDAYQSAQRSWQSWSVLTGDLLLVEVAQRLRELLRDVDIIARLGGDEFIVVMAGALTPELVSAVAIRIVQSLSAPYHFSSQTMYSGASGGIAVFPDDAANAATLLRHADTAIYVARSHGRGNFQFYSPATNVATHERLLMENRIWVALGQQQFELYLRRRCR
ncbi:diguanylate cyclase domain-containing protein [Massilia sp. TWR1-2-2]|uniref:diguanylate cyclase domain-containing protein n=1 Tax=Massilia sp. TWR1-2-2 TaxID=2804584 RepID=UPI003CE8F711